MRNAKTFSRSNILGNHIIDIFRYTSFSKHCEGSDYSWGALPTPWMSFLSSSPPPPQVTYWQASVKDSCLIAQDIGLIENRVSVQACKLQPEHLGGGESKWSFDVISMLILKTPNVP